MNNSTELSKKDSDIALLGKEIDNVDKQIEALTIKVQSITNALRISYPSQETSGCDARNIIDGYTRVLESIRTSKIYYIGKLLDKIIEVTGNNEQNNTR